MANPSDTPSYSSRLITDVHLELAVLRARDSLRQHPKATAYDALAALALEIHRVRREIELIERGT